MGKLRDLDDFVGAVRTGTISRREVSRLLMGVGIATVTLPVAARNAAAANPLEVFSYADYASDKLRARYDGKFGAPSVTIISDEDQAFQKVRAGYTPDVVVVTTMYVGKWNAAAYLKPLDTSRLENWDNIFDSLKNIDGVQKDGKPFALPFVWGNSSVLYRTDLAPEYVENESWNILWDKKYKGRLSQRDAAPTTVLEAALVLGFKDPYSIKESDLPALRQKMAEQRNLLRYYWSSQADIEQSLASGELVAAYAWNSSLTRLLKEQVKVKYMVPKEGILTWVDTHVLLNKGKASEDEQYAYLNALSSPEVGRVMVEDFGYGTSNRKAFDLVSKEKVDALGMTDPAGVLSKSIVFRAFDPGFDAKISKLFEEVKAG